MIKDERIIAIASITGAGKTTLARNLIKERGGTLIELDMFYLNNSYELAKLLGDNYDHPFLFSREEIKETLEKILKGGKKIKIPVYNYETGKRVDEKEIEIKYPVIFEGIFAIDFLKESDLKIFVEAPLSEVILRRIIRDLEERYPNNPEITLSLLINALTMWKIYGKNKKKKLT